MQNKWMLCLLAAVLLFGSHPVGAVSVTWREYYVSPDGSDTADGSKNAPFQSIARAQQEVRLVSGDMQGDIVVHILSGYYFLEDTLRFDNADSGKNGHQIIYRGHGRPVISGGVPIRGFRPSDTYPGLYEAAVSGIDQIRELYVNEKKRWRASSNRSVTAIGPYNDPNTHYSSDGMYMDKSMIDTYENAEDIEFQWLVNWKYSTANVASIEDNPDNPQQVIVRMRQSWWNFLSNEPTSQYGPRPERKFVISNAFELLDLPGEFYYNRKSKTLYYLPVEGEDMEHATVIAPRVEKLLTITGAQADNQVSNLTFEGMKFAHAAFDALSIDGIYPIQAQSVVASSDLIRRVPGAIEINRAKNIRFLDNYFFGMGAAGISMVNAVDDSCIDGNAFSDINDSAISYGWIHQNSRDAPPGGTSAPPPDGSVYNLVNGVVNGDIQVAASYWGETQKSSVWAVAGGAEPYIDEETMTASGITIANEALPKGQTWRGNPYAKERGERQWVRYDFQTAHHIHKIRLFFDTANITGQERTNFEVLLSNDEHFSEGNYTTVAIQTTPAEEYVDYEPQDGRYRYLMIRTREASNLALSGVWALTHDIKPYTLIRRNLRNSISNNYITRTGSVLCSGSGICTYYSEELKVEHNEISDIPYSGIMFGWGWANYTKMTGSANNRICYNYLHNVTTTMHDGGGIYTLGDLIGTIGEGNYVDGVFIGRGAIYTDNGSSRSVWRNNVSEDTYNNYFVWEPTIRENSYLSSYGTTDFMRQDGADNTIEPITAFLPGNPTPEAYAVMQEAGLTSGHAYLKDLVYEDTLKVPEKRMILLNYGESYIQEQKSMLTFVINRLLAEGSFGRLPGQYPGNYRFLLMEAREKLAALKNDVHSIDTLLNIRELVNQLSDAVYRLEYDEMLALCESMLQQADKTQYSQAAIQNFRSIVAAERAASPQSIKERYAAVLTLEKGLQAFENAAATHSIDCVWAENVLDVTVDDKQKEVHMFFAANEDLTAKTVTVVPYASATVGDVFIDRDLTCPLTVPIYHKNSGRYEMWRIVAERVQSEDIWYTSVQEKGILRGGDGRVYLQACLAPYMCGRKLSCGDIFEMKFVPMSHNSKNAFTFLFGAGRAKGFELASPLTMDDHYAIKIDGTRGALTVNRNGQATTLAQFDVRVFYNEENCFIVQSKESADGSLLTVTLNGSQLVNLRISDKAPEGFCGFYTDAIAMKIK